MVINNRKFEALGKEIKSRFFSHNNPASNFADEEFKEKCLQIFNDFEKTRLVFLLNNSGMPPAKAVLLILCEYYDLGQDKVLSERDSQNLGALLTFVFKDVMKYEVVKERATVGINGVKVGRVFSKKDSRIKSAFAGW